MRKKKFTFRAFISLSLFLSFLFDAFSGLVLYAVPSGSDARWNNWRLLGLTKDGWVAVHTVFSFVLVFFVIIHVTKNWKSIQVYVRRRIKKIMGMGREFVLASLLMLAFFTGAVLEIPPFNVIIVLGSKIQEAIWPGSPFESIDSHPERLTFNEFFEKAGVSRELALNRLREKGVVLENPEMTLEAFTRETGMSPADIYEVIAPR